MIEEILLSAVKTVNADLPPEMHLEPSWDTPLLGEGRRIDSMGIVSLLSEIEGQLSDKLGVAPDLWEEWSGGEADNPLRTLGSLRDYLAQSIGGTELSET